MLKSAIRIKSFRASPLPSTGRNTCTVPLICSALKVLTPISYTAPYGMTRTALIPAQPSVCLAPTLSSLHRSQVHGPSDVTSLGRHQ